MQYPSVPFNLEESIDLLTRTPTVLKDLLRGLPDRWTAQNEGGSSWSPHAVLGHLIHGEQTDWIPRLRIILGDGPDKRFEEFDRLAQFHRSDAPTVSELLEEFVALRAKNIDALRQLELPPEALQKTGIHPEFGTVTARQLLATWTVHDLGHIGQITRVMARLYQQEVGPWVAYLGVLKRP
jgi:uncharacterized damage-inducible protein DinB